jgi:hypothetical protein
LLSQAICAAVGAGDTTPVAADAVLAEAEAATETTPAHRAKTEARAVDRAAFLLRDVPPAPGGLADR